MAYEGTINLLSNFASQKYAENLKQESPTYKQALANLMQEHQQAAFKKSVYQQMGLLNPTSDTYGSDMARLASSVGDFTPLQEESDEKQKKRDVSLQIKKGIAVPDTPEGGIAIKKFLAGDPAALNKYPVRDSGMAKAIIGLGENIKKAMAIKVAGAGVDKEMKFNNIEQILDEVESLYSKVSAGKGEGFGGKAEAYWDTAKSYFGLAPDIVGYRSVVPRVAVQIARGMGDVGNIAVIEQKMISELLPKTTDTPLEGQAKLKTFGTLIRAIKAGNKESVLRVLKATGIDDVTLGQVNNMFKPVSEKELMATFQNTDYSPEEQKRISSYESGIDSIIGGNMGGDDLDADDQSFLNSVFPDLYPNQ